MRARAMRSLLAGAPALGAAGFLVSAVDGAAAQSATRLIDRTLTCTTRTRGGVRVIFVRAQSAFGGGATLEWLASADVSTAGQPLPFKPNYRPSLAGVNAGWPPPAPLKSGGLGFESRRCTTSKARVALSSRGLTGGPAAQLGDEYTCIAEGRIDRGQIVVATTS